MAVIDTPEFSKFRIILADLLSTDNEARNTAEGLYDEIPPSKRIFFLLAAVGTDIIPPKEIELAAILLRRLFCSSDYEVGFKKLPLESQVQIKNQMLHLLYRTKDRNLCKKISNAAAQLARNCIDDDGNNFWPDFLKFLFDAACSQDPVLKEVSLLMFSQVPGVFGNQQSKYIGVIHQMLVQSLTDQSSIDVRFAAMKATSSFMLAHEKESDVQKHFSDCVSLLIQLLAQVLDNPDEQTEDLLRYIVDLVESCYQSFRSHIDLLFEVCIKGMTIAGLESCRHLSLEVLLTLIEAAPAMVRKLGAKHLPNLISAIFNMMVDIEDDPNWDFDEDDSDEENDSNNIVGEGALDRIACALGGRTILPIVLNSLPLMLNSPDWKNRYAGLMTISNVGEGCLKQMSNMLSQIVDGVLPFLMDPHNRVRYAACSALGQMSTDFAPIFQKKFGEKVITGLLQLLGNPSSPRVQAHAAAALVNLFEDCPRIVLYPFIDDIADKLEVVLRVKLNELVEKGTKLVLEQIVVTIASLADSMEENFLVFYDQFMPCFKFILEKATQKELRLLRGKTIECISLIGLAVGKHKFKRDAGEVMDLLLQSQTSAPLADDDPQLSYMIAAWARMCKILGKEFEPYLPFVMQPVLKTASIKPEIAVLDAEDMKVVENDDDWEFVNLVGKQNFGIRTSGLEDKATACNMLVCYAKELKEGFAPYVEETLKLMVPLLKFYFHDGVREAAAEILPHLLECAKVRGDVYVREMWRYIVTPFLQALEYEPEPDVLCNEMSAFSQCIEVLNYKCLNHEDLMTLITLLNKKLLDHFEKAKVRDGKREEEDYDEIIEEQLEKEDDDDVYILSKISDVVSTLFTTYKEDFFPYFDALLPHYVKLTEPGRGYNDFVWALCVFSDVIECGGHQCTRYQQYFLQPIMQSLNHENVDLRQTAAYAIGTLGQFGGPEFASVCAESLPILIGIINAQGSRLPENTKATENAISAVGKFLMYNNSMINMEEILPLWLSWLPIWEDEEESKFVYNFLCSMLETNNRLLMGEENCNLPRIVQIIAEAFHKNGIIPTSDVGKRVICLMKDIQNNSELFNIITSTLNLHQQEALHAALTTQ